MPTRKRRWSKAQRAHFTATMRAKRNNKLNEFTKEVNRDFVRDNLFTPYDPKTIAPKVIAHKGYLYERTERIPVVK